MTTEPNNEIIIYNSPEGNIKIDVRLQDETVWLTIEQMATLFGKSRATVNEHILNIFDENELDKEHVMRKIGISDFSTISEHIKNIFSEEELEENSVVRNFRTAAWDGKTYETNYNIHVFKGSEFETYKKETGLNISIVSNINFIMYEW